MEQCMLISQYKLLFRPVEVSFPSTRRAKIWNMYYFFSLRCTFAPLTSPAFLTQLLYSLTLLYSTSSHSLLQMPVQTCLSGEAISEVCQDMRYHVANGLEGKHQGGGGTLNHCLPVNLLWIQFFKILPSISGSPKQSFPSGFPTRNLEIYVGNIISGNFQISCTYCVSITYHIPWK